jgi:hypothetical protein
VWVQRKKAFPGEFLQISLIYFIQLRQSRGFYRDALAYPQASTEVASTYQSVMSWDNTSLVPVFIPVSMPGICICFIPVKWKSLVDPIPGPDWYESLKKSTQYKYWPGLKKTGKRTSGTRTSKGAAGMFKSSIPDQHSQNCQCMWPYSSLAVRFSFTGCRQCA